MQRLCPTDRLTIIAGDFNLPDINWSYYSGPNTAIYDTFLNFVNNYGFHQCTNKDLHEIIIILDIVMATSDTFLSNLNVIVPLSTSHHNTIILRGGKGREKRKGEEGKGEKRVRPPWKIPGSVHDGIWYSVAIRLLRDNRYVVSPTK